MYSLQPPVTDINQPKALVVIEGHQMVMCTNIAVAVVVQTAVEESVTAGCRCGWGGGGWILEVLAVLIMLYALTAEFVAESKLAVPLNGRTLFFFFFFLLLFPLHHLYFKFINNSV
jgi:hypothetical protein